jgi:hypothetical protein
MELVNIYSNFVRKDMITNLLNHHKLETAEIIRSLELQIFLFLSD